jgi:hypothetical protein
MGIQGLIPLLESASRDININELNGLVAVIDAYGWIHRFCELDLFELFIYLLHRF